MRDTISKGQQYRAKLPLLGHIHLNGAHQCLRIMMEMINPANPVTNPTLPTI